MTAKEIVHPGGRIAYIAELGECICSSQKRGKDAPFTLSSVCLSAVCLASSLELGQELLGYKRGREREGWKVPQARQKQGGGGGVGGLSILLRPWGETGHILIQAGYLFSDTLAAFKGVLSIGRY